MRFLCVSYGPFSVKFMKLAVDRLMGYGHNEVDEVSSFVSGPSVSLRQAPFPKMNRRELKDAIMLQLEKCSPFTIDEAILDFKSRDHSPQAVGPKVEVKFALRQDRHGSEDDATRAGGNARAGAGARVAHTWAPKDEAEGRHCRSHGKVGIKSRGFGSIGHWDGGDTLKAGQTASVILNIVHLLAKQADKEVPYCTGEVSPRSRRLDMTIDLDFKASIFTRLNQEDQKSHRTIGAFRGAKKRLWAEQMPDAASVANSLDSTGRGISYLGGRPVVPLYHSLEDLGLNQSVLTNVTLVFGCGGDHNRSKRPLVGVAAGMNGKAYAVAGHATRRFAGDHEGLACLLAAHTTKRCSMYVAGVSRPPTERRELNAMCTNQPAVSYGLAGSVRPASPSGHPHADARI